MLSELRENIFHCLRCGACRLDWETKEPICPSGMKYGFDSHYAIGRVSLARAVLEGSLQLDGEVMKRVYTCTSCGACDVQCNPAVGIEPLAVIEALKHEGIEKGLIPPEVRDFLKNISTHGNPYFQPASERGAWAEGTGIEPYAGQEYLYYVGCVGSYDERGKEIARSVGRLLLEAGVSFGILGERELCDGNEVKRVGEQGLSQFLAENNIALFRELGVKKIVTLSPHSFNAIREYATFGYDCEVVHYTQLLKHLIEVDQLRPIREINKSVSYHDPCFLGRHNHVYDAPRIVLESLPGLQLVEMERNRDHSFCCGGGGGNFFTDLIGSGARSPSRIRVQEASGTGAEILAVACPNCHNLLEDATKTEGIDGGFEVKDISQLVLESCFPEGGH